MIFVVTDKNWLITSDAFVFYIFRFSTGHCAAESKERDKEHEEEHSGNLVTREWLFTIIKNARLDEENNKKYGEAYEAEYQ